MQALASGNILLAFIARCSFDNQHRDQGAGAAQTGEGKSQITKEKDVDALTFMCTVIMFLRQGDGVWRTNASHQ